MSASTNRKPILQAKGIARRFSDNLCIGPVDLEVFPGECLALIGRNGAGKTTLLRMLSGYIPPDEGEIRCTPFMSIGYLGEGRALPLDMRVEECLSFRAKLRGVDREKSQTRVAEMIELLSIGDFRKRRIEGLSRGMYQRVALAEAMLAKPDLILLDEPAMALDPVQRRAFFSSLKRWTQGSALVISSHLVDEMQSISDRLCLLESGMIVDIFSREEIETQPDWARRIEGRMAAESQQ